MIVLIYFDFCERITKISYRAAVAELVRASTIRYSNRITQKVPSSNPATATDFRMMTDLSVRRFASYKLLHGTIALS